MPGWQTYTYVYKILAQHEHPSRLLEVLSVNSYQHVSSQQTREPSSCSFNSLWGSDL